MADQGSGQRRGLGKGLGALIVNTDLQPEPMHADLEHSSPDGMLTVEIDQIAPNPHQPRTRFDEESLLELAASIQEHGIIQPLVVTAATQGDGFCLIAGERRWRAAGLAGLDRVPVIVREASSEQLVEWALVENVQRADLNALEEAAAYRSLMDEYRLTQAEVAQRVGKSRSAIANSVRLLQLAPPAQSALVEGQISAGHARALLALVDAEESDAALATILENDLNVRQAEELVKRLNSTVKAPIPETPAVEPTTVDEQIAAELQRMESGLRAALGTRVDLNRNADGTGRLVVHFYDDDDLQNIHLFLTGHSDR